MKKQRILFFDTKPYDRKSFEEVNKNYGFEITYLNMHLNPHSAALTKGFEVICIFVNDFVNKAVIEQLKQNKVRLIALRSAGYNNVDLKELSGKIQAVRVPAYSPHGVAEHAVALILGLNRKIYKAYARVRDGNFSIDGLLGFDLHGRTAGIIGTGKIGRCLVSILKGFGMKILAYDVSADRDYAKQSGITYVDLPELYKKSDIISLHCPLTPDNYHMINKETISQMKDKVMIINTGRGKLIDTKDLIVGLKSSKVGSAGLDVYEEEEEYFFEDLSSSLIGDDVLARLLTFPNVLITSHQAFFTKEALTKIANTTLQNIREYFEGKYLENAIQPDKNSRKN
jgi:D-lactate dehydrogenase